MAQLSAPEGFPDQCVVAGLWMTVPNPPKDVHSPNFTMFHDVYNNLTICIKHLLLRILWSNLHFLQTRRSFGGVSSASWLSYAEVESDTSSPPALCSSLSPAFGGVGEFLGELPEAGGR